MKKTVKQYRSQVNKFVSKNKNGNELVRCLEFICNAFRIVKLALFALAIRNTVRAGTRSYSGHQDKWISF